MEKRAECYELQRLMEEQGITQRELSERAGVDETALSLARKGKKGLGLENERKVVKALGVRMPELMGREGRRLRRGGDGSVRLVAGQGRTVAYPEISEKSGVSRAGGDGSEVVSVAGLRNRRAFKKLSQSELARRSGVNRTTVGQAEKKGRATRGTARLLAGALSVEVEELAEPEQKSRFPESGNLERGGGRAEISTKESDPRARSRVAADSSPEAREEERPPVKVELSEPVLRRVDRLLDLLESALASPLASPGRSK